jgi:hypothetical protein
MKNMFKYGIFLIVLGIVFSSCKKNLLEDVEAEGNYYDGYLNVDGLIIDTVYKLNCRAYFKVRVNPELNIHESMLARIQVHRQNTHGIHIYRAANELNTVHSIIDISAPCYYELEYTFTLVDKDDNFAGNSVKVSI